MYTKGGTAVRAWGHDWRFRARHREALAPLVPWHALESVLGRLACLNRREPAVLDNLTDRADPFAMQAPCVSLLARDLRYGGADIETAW